MKTPKEHDQEWLCKQKVWKHNTNIACPKCGEEMHYTGISYLTNPPKREIVCNKCMHIDSIY